MGFPLNGFVLRAPRTSPSNAVTSDEAVNGVEQDYKRISGLSTLPPPESPDLVSVFEDHYRASTLGREDDGQTEYLLWAANSGNLSTVENFPAQNATGDILPGDLPVRSTLTPLAIINDGSNRLVLRERANQSIAGLETLVLVRGDNGLEILVSNLNSSFSPVSNVVTLNDDVLADLDGGLSEIRGDTIRSIEYRLAAVRFWWSKNDRYETRFQWNGTTATWEPLKGTPPRDLGALLVDEDYKLDPVPQVALGEYLPGNSNVPDDYSMIRLGTRPDANSTPVAQPVSAASGFGGILVVTDDEATEEYDFAASAPDAAAVMGVASGRLQFNPAFLDDFAGQTLWYSYKSFLTDGTVESLGPLETAIGEPHFLAPIPGPTDYPFIRIGNRTALEAIVVATEDLLNVLTVNEGQVGVAASTGRLKFSQVDVDRSNPDSTSFDRAFLGAEVYYDGVSLTQVPLQTKLPVRLLDGAGDVAEVLASNPLYVPDAVPWPSPGTSGVQHIADGTGTLPNTTQVPGIRANGSGLVREVRGDWDLFLFNENGLVGNVRVVDDAEEIPRFPFQIPRGTAYLNLNLGAQGSEITLGKEDRRIFNGQNLWFLQTSIQPAVYASESKVYSRVRDSFELVGDEVLKFAIEGNVYLWEASTDPGGVLTSEGGTFSADEIARSLNAVITVDGEASVFQGRVVLDTGITSGGRSIGSIEIGFGPGDTRDLSGPRALGFLPGWGIRISSPAALSDVHWLADNGSHLGVYRSPLNQDGRKSDISDVTHRAQLDDVVVFDSIPASPVVLLDRIPLEDQPGYDDNVFFRLQTGLASQNLDPYEEIVHQFGFRRFVWAEEKSQFSVINIPTTDLQLGAPLVFEQSLRIPGKGLRVSDDGGPFVDQVFGEDYKLLSSDPNAVAQPGIARLITTVGGQQALGVRGFWLANSTTFSDADSETDFVALGVEKGWQLKIASGPEEGRGTYLVTADATVPNELEVSPALPFNGSGESWELYQAPDENENDVGIVADVQYLQFNHLLSEPFIIRTLSSVGEVPTSPALQQSNRLSANITRAIESGRIFQMRFGTPNASPRGTMVALQQVFLGELINGALQVPDATGERFANSNFSVRVGTKKFTFADGNLVKVAGALSFPLTGDIIEVQDGSGDLNFGDQVFADLPNSDVYYIEEFADPNLSPTLLPAGTVEYQVSDGLLNFAAADLATYGGQKAYFEEQMVTENGQDVTISPIQGSVLFATPLDSDTVVEVEYFRAKVGSGELELDEDGNPIKIIEDLPLFVDREVATLPDLPPTGNPPSDFGKRLNFNFEGKTIRQDLEEAFQIYIGNNLANVGGSASPTVGIDFEANQLVLQEPVDSSTQVLVTYPVNETFGGEQSFTVSNPPVYRPPFRIPAVSDSFTLEGDRTSDVVPGKVLRVGPNPFYLTSSVYDAGANETTVEIFPSTAPNQDAGTLAPGNDVLTLITDRTITKAYDPTAAEGIWAEVPNTFEPVNRGFLSIVFFGDLTGLAISGHLLEIGGYPFVIGGSNLSDDGTRTIVDLTSATPTGFGFGFDSVRITIRPIYAPSPTEFVGRGPVLSDEPFELVLFGETDASGNLLPGRTLQQSVDYNIDFDSGGIEFLSPGQGPLRSGQTLYLRHTQLDVLSPFLQDGVVVTPRFLASYVRALSLQGDEGAGIAGEILRAKYTFSSPDNYFYRTIPVLDYLSEVGSAIARDATARLPSRGAIAAIPPAIVNHDQGNLGLRAQISDLEDQDRAARLFIEFYNDAILAFEQVTETITGNIVGDRDGKFKFFVGRNREVPPPGYEDQISGELNRRNVFSELFFAYNRNIVHLTRDPLVNPNDASLSGDQIVGSFIDPDFLGELINQQKDLVANDIDDIVLVSRTRKRLRLNPFRLEAFGKYRKTSEPSRFSRLFPEEAGAFTLTDPGIGADLDASPVDPGVYSFLRVRELFNFKGGGGLRRASTYFKSIGDIGNPVLGQLSGISGISVQKRLPRARIFAYSPVGFPELDISFIGSPRPAVIATVLPLHDFPLRDDGFPDVSQLIANGGALPDLSTGDPDLLTPAFFTFDADSRRYPQITFGRPTGDIIDIVTNKTFPFPFGGNDQTLPRRLFVEEILQGCILTFIDDEGDSVTSSAQLLQQGIDENSAEPLELDRGDTIFISPPQVDFQAADPPDNAEKEAQVEGIPNFRVGFDVRVDNGDGEYVDISMPSIRDPLFPFKEIFGQRTPSPLEYLEADVRFSNSLTEPAEIPALTGGFLNDDGDYTLPYLYAQNTELDRLGESKAAFENLLGLDSPLPGAVYPDEIQGIDGSIIGGPTLAGAGVASLNTSFDATPVATAGAYTANSGIGDVAPFDLLFIEAPQTALSQGATGILSVGAVQGGAAGSSIEPPRFVTPTTVTSRIRYSFRTIQSFVNQGAGGNPPGMVINSFGAATTTFDITTVSPGFAVFNNGAAVGSVGGFNDILSPNVPFAYPNNDNIIRIHIWTADDNVNPVVYVGAVEIRMNGGAPVAEALFSGLGPQPVAVQPTFEQQLLTIQTAAAFLTVGNAASDVPEDPLNPGFSRPLWYTIDVDTTGATGASTSGAVLDDRLTFQENVDMRSALDRSTPPIDGQPVSSELSVEFVTGPGSEDVTVNAPAEVNGGLPFTFLNRSFSFPQIGSFDLSTGVGSIKVPAFEGFGNTPILGTGITFSAVPSSSQDENGIIASGVGTSEAAAIDPDFDNRVATSSADVLAGDLNNVEPGDVLVVSSSELAVAAASTKAGTYIVKHAVQPDLGEEFQRLELEAPTFPLNTQQGWLQLDFPTAENINVLGGEITLSSAQLGNSVDAWPATGRIYFLINTASIADTISVAYTSYDPNTAVFTINAASVQDANGGGLAAGALLGLEGTYVSGFFAAEVRMDRAGFELPRNLVGYRQAGADNTAFGFGEVFFDNTDLAGSLQFSFAGGPDGDVIEGGAPLANEIRVLEHTPTSPNTFTPVEDQIVYPSVASTLVWNLSNANWTTLHGGVVSAVDCLFPGDNLVTRDDLGNQGGFRAQAGVFLEPSVPRPVFDLSGPNAHVVDTNNTLPAGDVGFRSSTAFGATALERVSFEVRRIRRFHLQQDEVAEAVSPLRYVYETRRGTVLSFGAQAVPPTGIPWPYVVQATDGTQLGGFDDPNVNVNPGDLFRLLDADGNLVDQVEIAAVVDSERLLLKAPGIVNVPTASVAGLNFEIYLRFVPVPHEQSNEQLLDLITDEVLLERTGDFSTQEGGYVPIKPTPVEPRSLRDTDTSINFANLGILEGDILLIDPAGAMTGAGGALPVTGQEFGTRPFGDRSVPNRTVATVGQEVPFIAGQPSELDDNRGWYRVTDTTPSDLFVNPASEFSGEVAGDFVTFGSQAEFAVLPTVSGSGAPFNSGGEEGQNDLRPTALAGDQGSPANSFGGNSFSVAPLSYRVFRPSPLFSDEAIDLVLLMRERTLSFIEEFNVLFRGRKGGSYFVFQRDTHISDLGNPLIPDEGLGVLSNVFIQGIAGLTQVSPFANATDCLSVLDRRFWVGDTRLDSERPFAQPAAPTYSTFEDNTGNPAAPVGDGRPVLTDLIEDVLDNNDQFRPLRLSWISARANREDGYIRQILIREREFPKQRRKQANEQKKAKSLQDAES